MQSLPRQREFLFCAPDRHGVSLILNLMINHIHMEEMKKAPVVSSFFFPFSSFFCSNSSSSSSRSSSRDVANPSCPQMPSNPAGIVANQRCFLQPICTLQAICLQAYSHAYFFYFIVINIAIIITSTGIERVKPATGVAEIHCDMGGQSLSTWPLRSHPNQPTNLSSVVIM